MPDEVKTGAEAAGKVDASAKTEAAPSRDEVIETWFRDHFAGTALGGTTELYNAGHKAKEDLKKRLAR